MRGDLAEKKFPTDKLRTFTFFVKIKRLESGKEHRLLPRRSRHPETNWTAAWVCVHPPKLKTTQKIWVFLSRRCCFPACGNLLTIGKKIISAKNCYKKRKDEEASFLRVILKVKNSFFLKIAPKIKKHS